MTPHPQHHPDEQYIITEHELFLFAANGFFDREERLEMYHAIQQRPYNAIPTPAAPADRLCDECNILELEERIMNLEQELQDARKAMQQGGSER